MFRGHMRRVLGIGLFSALASNRDTAEAEAEAEAEEEVEPIVPKAKPKPVESAFDPNWLDTLTPVEQIPTGGYRCSVCGEKKGYFRESLCKRCKKLTSDM